MALALPFTLAVVIVSSGRPKYATSDAVHGADSL
jgi:hypothetical protein